MAQAVQSDNVKAAAAYFFSIIPFGFIVAVVILLMEKKSRYVKFHAVQAIIVFVSFFVLGWVLGLAGRIGNSIAPLLSILSIILWIVLTYKAYKGEYFKLPYVGDIAEQQVGRLK